MDAYQQPHRYMRPPPPSLQQPPTADHNHQHHHFLHQHQQQAPRPPLPPHGNQWYANQFHYQHPSSHSPSPPPASSYPPPPPPPLPYPAHHHQNNNNYYPLPPRPPAPPQISQSYPLPNQDWGNTNWGHHQQSWDYAAHSGAQDWAARAKEWANARAATENQHLHSQFTPVSRPEEQNHFHDQYPQASDLHYADTQHHTFPASGYQQFPVPAASSQQPPVAYQQETASISSAPSSYIPDVQLPHAGRDGSSARESNAGFPHQESLHSSSSVHQQEVPSSYSSVTGKEESADQKEHMYRSFSMPISSGQEGQPFAFGNQAADPIVDLSNQPLEFAPRFNHDPDVHMQSSYAAHHDLVGTLGGVDPAAAVASVNSWNPPVASGVGYPPIPSVLQSGPQHDPSMAIASVPGPVAPQFGRFPGLGFQPALASTSAFCLGGGAALHPSTAFPGDAYGVSGVSERPKKAPVPNWLKEEIIKNKAAITKSSLENPKEESESIDDESAPRSFGKGDQADSKSLDSSKSTEEEDDDEDYMEAARTAAINLEIKRILTEVLLKVTDELFDEIATKVLMEDDLTIEVEHNNNISNHKVSPSSPAVPTPKASAKVLVPVRARESDSEETSEKTSSSYPGDVLGLANYASDDDAGDEEIQNSGMTNSRNNAIQQSSTNKLSEKLCNTTENGSPVGLEEHNRGLTNLESDPRKSNASTTKNNNNGARERLNEKSVDSGKLLDGNNDSGLNIMSGEKTGVKTKSEISGADIGTKKSTNDNSQNAENRLRSFRSDRHESKKGSRKEGDKEIETGRRASEKGDENCRREDERHLRKEKTDHRDGSRDKRKDYDVRHEEKAKESKSRKRSTNVDVEDRRDTEKHHRSSTKEFIDKEHKQSKEEDSSRHKLTSDSSKHKRRRSSSVSSKGRNSKENSVSLANESSDDTSDDSKRRPHSRKSNFSPSPDRSRRRQVTRSPHSKHSQRRHSPYPSLERTRHKFLHGL
ncbi:uncharacterized protein LOC123213512 isoform X2 [Mangifera indica]|uniref:uncharacterized protein LOC123213512 isoform X2 n=1 Tax=Mangifera indica TaxID=29780 RepID=UPI001CFA375D|nr:uncharacterized protein LOC123213512 isoform X2 [Mangifera indica]